MSYIYLNSFKSTRKISEMTEKRPKIWPGNSRKVESAKSFPVTGQEELGTCTAIRERQKPVTCPYQPVSWWQLESLITPSVGKDVGKPEPTGTATGRVAGRADRSDTYLALFYHIRLKRTGVNIQTSILLFKSMLPLGKQHKERKPNMGEGPGSARRGRGITFPVFPFSPARNIPSSISF